MTYDVGLSFKIAQMVKNKTTLEVAEDHKVSRQQVQRWRTGKDMHISKAEEFAEYF